jgi:hypothetical protein
MRIKRIALALICLIIMVGLKAQSNPVLRQPVTGKNTNVEFLPDSLFDELSSKEKLEKLYKTAFVDTANIRIVEWNADFRDKYLSDKDFVYEQHTDTRNFLIRFFQKVKYYLQKLFSWFSFDNSAGFNWMIIKILSVLILIFAVYFISKILINKQGKWMQTKDNVAVALDLENTEQLIQEADFKQLIAEMEQAENSRQAIRLYYLWLLKELQLARKIKFQPEKTNADYTFEISDSKLREQFTYLSYLYNYIWYGEFSINQTEYLSAKAAFETFLSKEVKNG